MCFLSGKLVKSSLACASCNQGERNVKYKELKKREEAMDDFLDTFEEVKANEQARKQQLEHSIVNRLEYMSRGMIRTKHLPSPAELQRMKVSCSSFLFHFI